MGLIAEVVRPDGEVILFTDESWECARIAGYLPARSFGERVQFQEHYDSRIPMDDYVPVSVRKHNDVVMADAPTRPLMMYEAVPGVCAENPARQQPLLRFRDGNNGNAAYYSNR